MARRDTGSNPSSATRNYSTRSSRLATSNKQSAVKTAGTIEATGIAEATESIHARVEAKAPPMQAPFKHLERSHAITANIPSKPLEVAHADAIGTIEATKNHPNPFCALRIPQGL